MHSTFKTSGGFPWLPVRVGHAVYSMAVEYVLKSNPVSWMYWLHSHPKISCSETTNRIPSWELDTICVLETHGSSWRRLEAELFFRRMIYTPSQRFICWSNAELETLQWRQFTNYM